MTTLAYSAPLGVLASDSMAVHGHFILGEKPKIGRRGLVLFGATGTSSAGCRRFLDWCLTGCLGEPPHAGDNHSGYMGYLFPGDDLVIQVCQQGINAYRVPLFAAGSGAALAKGALEAGATPREAIAIARRWDVYTNGPIQEVTR